MKMVSLRDSNFCGVAPSPTAADRRVERTCAAGGVWGGMPRRPADFFARGEKGKFKSKICLCNISS